MGTQLVNLPLTSSLTDSKGNLTSGGLLRASDSTYINASGVLSYSRGNRTNLVLYSEDTSQANWVGGTTQTFTLTVNTTYLLSVHKAGVTLTLAAGTGAYTVLSGTTATYGSPVAFTMTTGGTVTIETDTANPKAQLEALPSGNVIGSDLMDQEVLGAELVTNGTFAAWTGDNPDGWIVDGESGSDPAISQVASGGGAGTGAARFYTSGAYFQIGQIILTDEKVFKYSIDVTAIISGALFVYAGSTGTGPAVQLNEVKTYSGYFIANASTFYMKRAGATDITIDNVSVREVTSPAKGSFDAVAMLAGSTELITNGGFETAGAGGADVHANWSETVGGTDTITNETTDKYLGSDALKLTNVDSGDTYQDQAITTSAGKLYKAVFFTRGDGTVGGRYSIYDASNSADIVATTATGVTGTSYTAVTKYFYTPTGCVSVRLRLQAPSAAGAAYFDYVSVRQVQQTWVKQGTETIEIDSTVGSGGLLKITGGDSAYGPYLNLANANDMSADLTVGGTYQVTFNAYVASGDTVSVVVAASDHTALASVSVTPTSSTAYTLNFKATHATTNRLEFASLDSGDIIYLDSITIKKVPPLAYLQPGTYTATAGTTATIPADLCVTSSGLRIQDEAANYVWYSDDLTNAYWTASNITPLKNVTDPWGTASGATRLTAGADNGTILATVAVDGIANNKRFSVWLKRITGTGAISLTDNNGSNYTEKTLTSEWVRYDLAARSQATPIVGIKMATSGDVIAAALAQVTKGTDLYGDIPTNGCPAITLSEMAVETGGVPTNGYSWEIGAGLAAALAESGTLLLDWIPGHAAAGGTGTGSGIVSVTNSATGLLYYDYDNTMFETTDGTNTETNTESITANTTYRLAVRWNDTGGLALDEKHSGTNTKETGASFDGDYNPGSYLYLGYGGQGVQYYKNIKIFDGWVRDANLDSPRARMLFPILPFFGGVKAYQY